MKDITIRFTVIGATLAAALAASGGVDATQVIGSIENEAGGQILLTNDKCGADGNGRSTIATFSGGRLRDEGCAYPLLPGRLLVRWNAGHSVLMAMTGWAPDSTDRSLKSFSNEEMDMLIVRTSWFEGKADAKPKANRWWKEAPLANPPAAAPMLVDQSRRTR